MPENTEIKLAFFCKPSYYISIDRMKVEKLLSVFLFLIILVLAGEGLFYLFINRSLPLNLSSPSSANGNADQSTAPTSCLSSLNQGSIANNILATSQLLDKQLIESSSLINYYQGTINEIKLGKVVWTDNHEYAAMIDLLTKENKHTGILLNQNDLGATSVFKKTGDNSKPISLNQLKKGDLISMDVILNFGLDDQSNLKNLTIYKLND